MEISFIYFSGFSDEKYVFIYQISSIASYVICNYRNKSLRKPINLVVVHLSVAGMMMMGKIPVFFINMFNQKPFTGVFGAKVLSVPI